MRDAHMLMAVAATLLVGCASAPASRTAEAAQRVELSLPESMGLLSVPALEGYLRAMLQRLLDAGGADGATRDRVQVRISASALPVAKAIDPVIYLPWTAVEVAQSEPEIAAVLAHEASHILLNHAARFDQTSWLGPMATFGPLLASASPPLALLALVGTQYADRAATASWARDQELAADAHALVLLKKAGYARAGLLDMLEALEHHSPRLPPPPLLAEKKLPDGRTAYTPLPNGINFQTLEESHPQIDERRAAARARMGSIDADVPSPAEDRWLALKATPAVQAALQGLSAARDAQRSGQIPAETARLARRALESPVADSFYVWITALRALPPQELAARRVQLPALRMARPDTPMLLPVLMLQVAVGARDWKTAADLSDLIRERYDPQPSLYATMGRVYDARAQQVKALMNNRHLSGTDSADLLKESVLRQTQSLNMLMQCASAARGIDKTRQCSGQNR